MLPSPHAPALLVPSQVSVGARTRSNDRKLYHMTPCFNDWKRFCSVLREIASGENGIPLTVLEAQRRARAVLVECGYPQQSKEFAGAMQ